MTTPVTHDLELNWEQTGPYSGPFPSEWVKGHFGSGRVFTMEGVAYWQRNRGAYPQKLTEDELWFGHRAYLQKYLGWSDDLITEWETGSYPSMSTVNIKVMQDFLKRLRTWFQRTYPDLPMFRMAYTGEYGDQYERAHYHIVLYGWPPYREAMEYLVYAWRAYHDDAIMGPDPAQIIHLKKSWLRPKEPGAAYVYKDVAKGRRHHRRSPAYAARTQPFVRQSLKPPLGQAALELWLERDILPIIEKAGTDEVEQCLAVRQAYLTHTLHIGVRRETFLTSDYWRGQAKTGWTPEVWEETTHELNKRQAAQVLEHEAQGTLEAEVHEHRETVAEKNQRNEKRALDRKKAKSTVRFLSDGVRPF